MVGAEVGVRVSSSIAPPDLCGFRLFVFVNSMQAGAILEEETWIASVRLAYRQVCKAFSSSVIDGEEHSPPWVVSSLVKET